MWAWVGMVEVHCTCIHIHSVHTCTYMYMFGPGIQAMCLLQHMIYCFAYTKLVYMHACIMCSLFVHCIYTIYMYVHVIDMWYMYMYNMYSIYMHVHVCVFPCAVQLTAEGVGCRFWHTTVMSHSSSRMRQLLTFGGCPGAPESHTTGSWPKMADTFLMEIGTECAVHMDVVRVCTRTVYVHLFAVTYQP